jgi:hypothetical protein
MYSYTLKNELRMENYCMYADSENTNIKMDECDGSERYKWNIETVT